MARLFADEDFPGPVVEVLRQLGHDVATVQDRGRAGEGFPDDEVLSLAASEDRAVMTRNRWDFFRLHRNRPAHAGIIACKHGLENQELADRIHAAVEAAGDLHGQLIRVNRPPPGS